MELTNNEVLKTWVKEIARCLGYKVLTNKSVIHFFGKKASRFQSSRPDFMMFSGKQHCAYMYITTCMECDGDEMNNNDSQFLTGATTENKTSTCTSTSEEAFEQLLGNMEKVAGDLVVYHLQECFQK